MDRSLSLSPLARSQGGSPRKAKSEGGTSHRAEIVRARGEFREETHFDRTTNWTLKIHYMLTTTANKTHVKHCILFALELNKNIAEEPPG